MPEQKLKGDPHLIWLGSPNGNQKPREDSSKPQEKKVSVGERVANNEQNENKHKKRLGQHGHRDVVEKQKSSRVVEGSNRKSGCGTKDVGTKKRLHRGGLIRHSQQKR